MRTVSSKVSPFSMDDPDAVMIDVSADSALAASSNEMRVRVEASAKNSTTVRPRSAGVRRMGQDLRQPLELHAPDRGLDVGHAVVEADLRVLLEDHLPGRVPHRVGHAHRVLPQQAELPVQLRVEGGRPSELVSARPGAGASRRDFEREAGKLSRLLEIAQTLSGEIDLQRLLHAIVETTFESMPGDRVSILLRDADGALVPRLSKNRFGDAVSNHVPRSIAHKVVAGRVTQVGLQLAEPDKTPQPVRPAGAIRSALRRGFAFVIGRS